MREINECTAEVFRRSEKRIKERKKNRNRVLAWCIPLCLIITLGSVTILPTRMPVSQENAADQYDTENAVGHRVSVQITGSDELAYQAQTITDPDRVSVILGAILGMYDEVTAETADDISESEDVAKGESFRTEDLKSKDGYTICFTLSDGSETKFLLNDYTLYDVTNASKIVLSENQLKELLGLFELKD